MASSSPKKPDQLWPGFVLTWLTRGARPRVKKRRVFDEYIAGVGMIQVNEQRKKEGLPVFEFATILIGIHQSDSDTYPHATVAAATQAMREANQHVMVHCRVSMDGTEFIGSLAYEEHIHEDDVLFCKSHSDPVPVRTSLAPQDDGLVPIGHITADGESTWYMYDQQEGIVYLEPGVFFRAGEGASGHIRFWNPVQNQICRASFQGAERPPTRSPDPQPVNLEAAMSELSVAVPPPQPTVEWVRPELQLDKNRAKPVAFSTQAGLKLRTGWERWEARMDDGRWTFVCVGVKTGNQYWAEYLPGEWVEPAWVQSSQKPIQFSNTQGELIKTTRSKWLAGQDGTFFVYMQQGKAYLTMARLPDD